MAQFVLQARAGVSVKSYADELHGRATERAARNHPLAFRLAARESIAAGRPAGHRIPSTRPHLCNQLRRVCDRPASGQAMSFFPQNAYDRGARHIPAACRRSRDRVHRTKYQDGCLCPCAVNRNVEPFSGEDCRRTAGRNAEIALLGQLTHKKLKYRSLVHFVLPIALQHSELIKIGQQRATVRIQPPEQYRTGVSASKIRVF
jgi:hypothetical protein